MKQPILILSSLLCICGMPCANASDSGMESVPNTIRADDIQSMRDTMDDLAKTRERVDELLIPKQTSQNLWTDDEFVSNGESVQAVVMLPPPQAQPVVFEPAKFNKKATLKDTAFSLGEQTYYGETVYIINNFLSESGDNIHETDGGFYKYAKTMGDEKCPFDNAAACEIWFRKPVITETVAPRSHNLRHGVMDKISQTVAENPNISANDATMKPLLERYQVLMRASQSCCTGGLTYRMRKAGATNDLIYKFLANDVNTSGFGSRCFVMDDEAIMSYDTKHQATTSTVIDVRNSCVCKSKENLTALLAPFNQLYQKHPDFAGAPFEYEHIDGLGRKFIDSVNIDVQNVLTQLDMCP